MNIGFTTVTFRKKSCEKIVEIAVKNGIKNIEWGGDIHLPYNDMATAKRVRAMMDSSGISAVTYGSYYRIGENNAEKFTQICEITRIIGAKIIRVWLGDKGSQSTSTEVLYGYVQEMRVLCAIAAQNGLTVASEFHSNTYNDSGAAAVDFITRVNAPNLMTMWQPLGDSDMANLIAVMPHLCEAHIFNWDSRNRRLLLAQGSEKWQQFLGVIKSGKPTINCILEFVKHDSARVFGRDVATLKSWCGTK